MQLRFRIATLAIVPLGIAVSGCSSHHVFHVESARARPHHADAPRSHAKKQHTNQANVKAKAKPAGPANDNAPSTWAGELD
jgi:hypothetical protein